MSPITQCLASAEAEAATVEANDELATTAEALDAAQAALDEQQAKFATEKKELTRLHEAATQAADDATQLASAATLRAETAEAAVSTAAQDSTPRGLVDTPPVTETTVYYQNCTAAREAGGAPVSIGGPGYGPHLDRDGDGVGCE
ncbi:excalibur calcium-binding domain-containing protein [Leucobacter luti]|uniref:excalibur calcium-binding domain-containing protein n=1 Tax=Leucobacter luti TaxID=340320 RepID=UPI00215D9556|nr:excalibur calcium-binding domain-containing protein [Leucobacter luti]